MLEGSSPSVHIYMKCCIQIKNKILNNKSLVERTRIGESMLELKSHDKEKMEKIERGFVIGGMLIYTLNSKESAKLFYGLNQQRILSIIREFINDKDVTNASIQWVHYNDIMDIAPRFRYDVVKELNEFLKDFGMNNLKSMSHLNSTLVCFHEMGIEYNVRFDEDENLIRVEFYSDSRRVAFRFNTDGDLMYMY